ncbi:hypothetical protein RhiirA4_529458 [Rhizophagus irregularis]|uniref:Ion transport domain-containing protein n=1 Tax=Rhizophagus irregularis TaxID=588596 RepID=A0A2I1FZX0_9GLOM|nr:hypothetical protein RhiirA4_529458 [Rhizophagus irregularis]
MDDIDYEKDDNISSKKDPDKKVDNISDRQIVICQDGKYVATFDTVNLRIEIQQSPNYRPFNKKKDNFGNENEFKGPVYFKINDDFTIDDHDPPSFDYSNVSSSKSDGNTTKNDKFRWSFDISNMYKIDGKHFVLIALSRINVSEDMEGTIEKEKDDNEKSNYKRVELSKREYTLPLNGNEHKVDMSPDSRSSNKGIAIYRIELKEYESEENEKDSEKIENVEKKIHVTAVTDYYSDKISGICKFIYSSKDEEDESRDTKLKRLKRFMGICNKKSSEDEKDKSRDTNLERFIVLNFHGIYDFKFNDHFNFLKLNAKKFQYPQNIRNELDNYYIGPKKSCMNRILSCIYNKYFLITRYKYDVQSLEVYNLAKMEHEIDAILVEKIVKQYDNYTFSVSRLQLCFAQINIIKLFHIENGLQIASKKFKEIEKIHLLEFIESDEKLLIIGSLKEGGNEILMFIIWDLYNTGKHKLMKLDDISINIKNIYTRLVRTSGNILYINDHGNVSSVLVNLVNAKELKPKDVKNEEKRIPHTACRGNIISTEPWILSFKPNILHCLYCNEEETKIETLELNVGRSTVQIWRQISDKTKKKDELPNEGKPFLEYIWSNNIPVNQERDQTKLRIEKLDVYESYEEMDDFRLKVYWYERKDYKQNRKKKRDIIEEENYEIDKIEQHLKDIDENDITINETKSEKIKRCEKVIRLKDVTEKFHTVKHACKALLHMKKRYKNNKNNYKYEEMINYVEHIVWRFAKHEPENFRLLDVRYNFMKNLILGDCDRLVKYILFGYGETAEKKINYRHIPSNKSWPGKNFIKGDDLFFDKKDKLKDKHMWKTLVEKLKRLLPDNLKRLLLDYPKYKFRPNNNMELAIYHCRGRELKDAIIVAYLLEYYSRNPTNCVDDFARKLFIRCFADQGGLGDLTVQDSDEIIPNKYLERYNSSTKFRAFAPEVKLKPESNKPKWFILLRDPKNTNIKIKESTYSGIATNLLTNEILDIKFKSDFDPTSKDNPFSAFFTSIEAAYFWITGNWIQREHFDFWAVDLFALIASIFLVTILQNILIAFMNGVYSTASAKGKQRLLRYQANHIVDYEALNQVYFSKPKPEPKHIYYFSQSKDFEEWCNKIKGEQCVIYEDFDFEVTSTSVIFKEKDYDEHSYLKYDDNIKSIIKDLLSVGNKLNVDIDNLIKIFKGDDNSIEKIDKIDVKDKKKCLKVKVEKLHDILEELKKKDL